MNTNTINTNTIYTYMYTHICTYNTLLQHSSTSRKAIPSVEHLGAGSLSLSLMHISVYIYIYIYTCIYRLLNDLCGAEEHSGQLMDSLRGSSVKLGTIQRILAWPLRKDDTHKSRSVNIAASSASVPLPDAARPTRNQYIQVQGCLDWDLGGRDECAECVCVILPF